MINGITLRNLKNADYLQFMKDTLALTARNNQTALNIVPQYEALAQQVADLETLFRVSQASELSQEVLQLDFRRDSALSGIRQVVDGYSNHFLPATANAAKLLQANLKLYGQDIERMNYRAETSTLNGIISDWESKAPLTDAMTLLNLKAWKDEMKAANILFNETYLERTEEYGAASEETISSEKAETNNLYYKLRDNIVARATIDNTSAYVKIINDLNALIEQYNVSLRNQEPKKENENPPQ